MALILVEKGTIWYRKGKIEQAMELFDQAIIKDSNCAEAYYNKGCALENQGKIEESNKSYEKAF